MCRLGFLFPLSIYISFSPTISYNLRLKIRMIRKSRSFVTTIILRLRKHEINNKMDTHKSKYQLRLTLQEYCFQ